MVHKAFLPTVLDLYEKPQEEHKTAKSKLPYGITILGKTQASIYSSQK